MEHSLMGCLSKIFGSKENNKLMMHESTSGTERKPVQTPDRIKKRTSMTRVLQPAHTIRLRPERVDQAESARPQGLLSLSSSGVTDRGLVRDHNEDWYALASFEDKSLFVVADGMGGHDSGEVASRIAADAVCRMVQEEHKEYDDLLSLVERAAQQANFDVRQQGARQGSDMGTTLSIALVSHGTAYVANVGDSRVYWMENGAISQVTTDHSLVAKLVDAGKLTKEDARNHPRANLLYRTIGIDEAVKVDTFRVDLKKGGTLLLCTDGLWGELTDEDIRRVCSEERDAKDVASRLVQRANEHGGKDNITAIVVRVP